MKTIYRKNEIKKTTNFAFNLFFIIICIVTIYPLLLVIGTSFADEVYLNKEGYKILPQVLSLDAYKYIVANYKPILRAYGISIFVTVTATVLATLVIGMYAYPLTRKDFRFKKAFTFFMFFIMLFNGGMVPWYIVCTQVLHLKDTIFALILPNLVSAWYVMIMKTFFTNSVPDSIIESAQIDGASVIKIYFKIVMPLALPGLATIALFTMVAYWNDWWLPLMLTNDPKLSNIQYYLMRIMNNLQAFLDMSGAASAQAGSVVATLPREGARMAITVLAIGPIVLAYPFCQKFFIQGLTVGAVKG